MPQEFGKPIYDNSNVHQFGKVVTMPGGYKKGLTKKEFFFSVYKDKYRNTACEVCSMFVVCYSTGSIPL